MNQTIPEKMFKLLCSTLEFVHKLKIEFVHKLKKFNGVAKLS